MALQLTKDLEKKLKKDKSTIILGYTENSCFTGSYSSLENTLEVANQDLKRYTQNDFSCQIISSQNGDGKGYLCLIEKLSKNQEELEESNLKKAVKLYIEQTRIPDSIYRGSSMKMVEEILCPKGYVVHEESQNIYSVRKLI